MGSDGGSGLAAAIAAGTATEMVLIAVLVMSAEYLAIKMVAKLFVKLLGPGIRYGLGSGSSSLRDVFWVWCIGWVHGLHACSESLVRIKLHDFWEVSAGYKKDLELLKKEAKSSTCLHKPRWMSWRRYGKRWRVVAYSARSFCFGESPTNYFNRTVHAGNIGIHGLDTIENYCSMALRLPELEQTIDFGQS